MSGLKPPEQTQFHRRLHDRGVDLSQLAEAINVSRPALTRVLNGSRRRGPIWKKVLPHLQPEEVALLDVAHCHPWNKKRVSKRPKWKGRGGMGRRASEVAA